MKQYSELFVLNLPSPTLIFSVIIFCSMRMDTLWWLILEVKKATHTVNMTPEPSLTSLYLVTIKTVE